MERGSPTASGSFLRQEWGQNAAALVLPLYTIQCPKKLEPLGKGFDLFMNETYYKAWLWEGGKGRRAVALVGGHHKRCGQR
jgi:hypothetical protein